VTRQEAWWLGGGLVAAAGTVLVLNQLGILPLFCHEQMVTTPSGDGSGLSGFCRWPKLKAYALSVGPGAATAAGRPCGYFWINLGPWQSAWGDPTNQDPSIPANWQALSDRVVDAWAMWYRPGPSAPAQLVRVYPQVQKVGSPEAQPGYFTGGYAC